MARLRNRMTKSEFWTDPELLSWPRDKRWFYKGLRAACEDSGCCEDSPFGWLLVLYPSPMDRDITVDKLGTWRDELIVSKKLIRYMVADKPYLYQVTFHDHEHPRNPQSPDLPLPPWIRWVRNEKDQRKGSYEVDQAQVESLISGCTDVEQSLFNDVTTVPAQTSPAQSSTRKKRDSETLGDLVKEPFEDLWRDSGKIGSKEDARLAYLGWTSQGTSPEDLYTATMNYYRHCEQTDTAKKHLSTFLSHRNRQNQPINRWKEWLEEEHGSSDNGRRPRSASQRVIDLLARDESFEPRQIGAP
jgi:hypothetical protein